ncbi:Glyoxylase, beta-lactamase superfamily II [Paenibacillus sp. 1_12]|uniref:MBL fold metallo-hydrolase n=1 Tax=Paenibacillus sp. 1_12 TaxID=1566278 RepID=UPI0008EEB863|nr:MBL fold metallo-hydrolase [Paenibacillus sp. 1_12]SFK99999.1 Glyoxylase, beta-lactamase superfamily II [Paenibacillus sp. 1_12]
MQLMKRIYQLSGEPYGLHPNVYAVLGDDAVVLIDCGTNHVDLKVIDQNLLEWGLSEYPVSQLLLTHSHFDHSGNAHIFSKRGSEIVAGCSDAEGIECGDERITYYSYNDTYITCKVDRKVSEGDVIQAAGLEFEVLHVPGHSRGSMAYRLRIDGKTVLFTGDALMAGPNGKAKLGVAVGADYDPALYLESLKRLSRVEADAVLGGHFHPCLRNANFLLKNGYRTGLFELRTLTTPITPHV